MIKIYSYTEKELEINNIKKLFEDSFGQRFDKEYWKWRFISNPNSNQTYIVYALDDNKLVAYYAVSPMKLVNRFNNTVENIALSNMTMTHPNYQGKGLFTKLATRLFEILKKDNFIGVYGFANSNSHYGFRKNLGWKDISILNIFKLKQGDFRHFLLKSNDNTTILTKKVDEINIDFINKFSQTELSLFLLIDKQNYTWRFNKIQNKQYYALEVYVDNDIEGVIVYKVYNSEVDIMEIWSREINKKNDILLEGIKYFYDNSFGEVNIWSNIHTTEHLILEKFGFKETEFNTYFGIIPFVNDTKYLELQNWHYRFIDSDIF